MNKKDENLSEEESNQTLEPLTVADSEQPSSNPEDNMDRISEKSVRNERNNKLGKCLMFFFKFIFFLFIDKDLFMYIVIILAKVHQEFSCATMFLGGYLNL